MPPTSKPQRRALGSERPLPFARDDSVDEGYAAPLRVVRNGALLVRVNEDAVQIEHRTPKRVVAIPAPLVERV